MNHRNIPLTIPSEPGQTVGVSTDGTIRYYKWLGINSRNDAKRLGKPVRLVVDRVDGRQLEDTEYVHGCYVQSEAGVYAVTDVAIIRD